ncbi:transposase domain-containing protein [Mesorhizobium captivum]|uniref:transposase domain-containing protein n=1 Tax=Mesorhizobium captivum TaxID=3072319 RepID=UPI003D6BAFC1
MATLLQTAKMNCVDPLAWLSQTLTRIAQRWPVAEIEMLMQARYMTASLDEISETGS